MKNKSLYFCIFFLGISLLYTSCKKDKAESSDNTNNINTNNDRQNILDEYNSDYIGSQ